MTHDQLPDFMRPAPASLPYAGTSGYSGSEASRQRAEMRDSTGRTGRLQDTIEQWVAAQGRRGATIKEVREQFTDEHHGSLSSTLTNLHKDGRVHRLTRQRDRCSIYVTPSNVNGREVVQPKVALQVKEVVLTADMNAEFIGHTIIAALNDRDRITVRVKR